MKWTGKGKGSCYLSSAYYVSGFPCDSAGKELACNVGNPGLGDHLEKGRTTHSSILAWRIPWTTVHGVTKSHWTQLSDFHLTTVFQALCHIFSDLILTATLWGRQHGWEILQLLSVRVFLIDTYMGICMGKLKTLRLGSEEMLVLQLGLTILKLETDDVFWYEF